MKKRKKARLFDDLLAPGERPAPKDIFDDLITEVKPLPTERTRDVGITMFWRREHCQHCRSVYEGSAYGTPMLLQRIIEKPVIHFGKLYGWRFHAIQYIPIAELSLYSELPRDMQTIDSSIPRCRKCVNRPNVVYLPAPGGAA